AYATAVKTITGTEVRNKQGLRVIDVADILFVQSGFVGSRKLEACKDKEPDLDAKKVVTIFHNNVNTTDFLVDDEADREAVLRAIQTIREAYDASKIRVGNEELLLRYSWYDTDWSKSGLVNQSEFLQLLGRVNIYLKQERAIQMFKACIAANHTKGRRLGAVKHHRKGLTFDECLQLLRKIQLDENKGVNMSDVIFNELFGGEKDSVTAEDFLTKFIIQKQNEKETTLDDVKKVFSHLNAMDFSGTAEHIGEDGSGCEESIDRHRFGAYLISRMNDLHDPETKKYDQFSLTSPLTHYWINSSHNTYLTGDQLKSVSSTEMYVVAMHRGCKCLELDVWDDSDGHPIVYHGYTLTSKIPFQDIITCVKGYVDANPETLPIILSLENHCSHPFQEMMAEILNDTLRERLYIPESLEELPSPLDLVGKVVIKGKRPPDDEDDLTVVGSMEDGTPDRDDDAKSEPGKKEDLPKIVPELARLTLFNGVKFKNFDTSMDLPLHDMHSFSEPKVKAILKSDLASVSEWREYNMNHMSRTYPGGHRIDSSNYNPVLAWHVGCQLVALNFQTEDSNMTINDGRFRENGGCGYVHKPPSVLQNFNGGRKLSLQIKILSGSALPKPYGESVGEVIDPYVVIRLHDVGKRGSAIKRTTSSQDDWIEPQERKTSSVRDNGFGPQWRNAEWLSFEVTNADVAMLEFLVMDNDHGFIDDLMCKSAVPVSSLRQGYRSVQFYDQISQQHGPFGFAKILLEVGINCV
ncbi:hypothetical protein ACHAWF_013813, partial [Thalassiosira exigua]